MVSNQEVPSFFFSRFLDLPPEIRNEIYRYSLHFARNACNLHQLCSHNHQPQPSSPPDQANAKALTLVSHQVRTESLKLLIWENDWSVDLHSNGHGFAIAHDSALGIAVSGFEDTTPLFRRVRICGDAALGGPYLAFAVRNGRAAVDHDRPCPLCAVPRWKEEVVRPERAPGVMAELGRMWQDLKAEHERGRLEMADRLFGAMVVQPAGRI